jgi:hypothetical protein
MSADQSVNEINFNVDKNNLYREESITDLKVASIRRLTPVKADGTEDSTRRAVFIGQTQLMSPEGPLPIQSELAASTIEEAIDAFPNAMQRALNEVVAKIKKMQAQQKQQSQSGRGDDSRIIVPGRS